MRSLVGGDYDSLLRQSRNRHDRRNEEIKRVWVEPIHVPGTVVLLLNLKRLEHDRVVLRLQRIQESGDGGLAGRSGREGGGFFS